MARKRARDVREQDRDRGRENEREERAVTESKRETKGERGQRSEK